MSVRTAGACTVHQGETAEGRGAQGERGPRETALPAAGRNTGRTGFSREYIGARGRVPQKGPSVGLQLKFGKRRLI